MNAFSIANEVGMPESISIKKLLGIDLIQNWFNLDDETDNNFELNKFRRDRWNRTWKKEVSEDLADTFGGNVNDYLKRFSY